MILSLFFLSINAGSSKRGLLSLNMILVIFANQKRQMFAVSAIEVKFCDDLSVRLPFVKVRNYSSIE
jgi:hypothetical protein